MENNNIRKYNFIAQVLILFAVDVLFLILIASFTGDDAKEISTMFQFGSKGLAISTLLQYLLNAFIIISLKSLFFSGKFLKNMMTLWRAVFMLASVLAVTIAFIIVFDWFLIDDIYAWVSFFIWFGGSFTICTSYMIIKTKLENKKYNELLSNYKDQRGGDHDNE